MGERDVTAAFDEVAVEPFTQLLAARNLRNRWLGRWAAGRLTARRTTRSAAFADALDADLLSTGPLGRLPRALQVVFTATDLGRGDPFRFAAEFVGSASYGYRAPPPQLRLASAVTASAAEPSYFSPLHLRTAELGLGTAAAVLSLVDGGVYDNLGTEWFEDWDHEPRPRAARRPEFLVVVDAGGPFAQVRRRVGSARSFLRAPAVSDAHMRSERVAEMRSRFDRGELDGVLLSLREPCEGGDAPPPLDDPEVWPLLARLRTDFDCFTPLESTLLVAAGYWSLHARLRVRRPELALERPARPLDLRRPDLRDALERGSRRLVGCRFRCIKRRTRGMART